MLRFIIEASTLFPMKGFEPFFARAQFFFKDWFFQNGIYSFYEIDLGSQLPAKPTHKTDFTLKIIPNLTEYNHLIIEQYNFNRRNFQSLLEKGAIAYCLFARKDLIYSGWVLVTEQAKREIDMVPYEIGFDRGEVGIGGYYCEPDYRGKGLHNYVLSICFRHLSENGVKKKSSTVLKRVMSPR